MLWMGFRQGCLEKWSRGWGSVWKWRFVTSLAPKKQNAPGKKALSIVFKGWKLSGSFFADQKVPAHNTDLRRVLIAITEDYKVIGKRSTYDLAGHYLLISAFLWFWNSHAVPWLRLGCDHHRLLIRATTAWIYVQWRNKVLSHLSGTSGSVIINVSRIWEGRGGGVCNPRFWVKKSI